MGSGDSKMDISNKTQNRFVLGPTNIILSQYYSIGLCKKAKSSLLVITITTKKLPTTLSYPRLCQCIPITNDSLSQVQIHTSPNKFCRDETLIPSRLVVVLQIMNLSEGELVLGCNKTTPHYSFSTKFSE